MRGVQHFRVKYGTGVTLRGIGLESVSTATRLFSGALTAGDVKISKDGGAFADLGTLPSETPAASGLYDVILTGTEATAAQIVVRFKDQDGPAYADKIVIIHTFGNAAALIKADLADAVRLGITALPNANAGANGGLPLGDAAGHTTDINSAAIKAVTDQFVFPVAGQVKAYAQQIDATERTALASAIDTTLTAAHGAGSWLQGATIIGQASSNNVPINADLTLGTSEDWVQTLTATGLDSTGWTQMVLIVKTAPETDGDGEELLMVRVTNPASGGTDGVLRVSRAAATGGQRTQGALSVSSITPNTVVGINITAPIMALLPPSPTSQPFRWELRRYTSGVAKRIGTGNLTIDRTLRRDPAAP